MAQAELTLWDRFLEKITPQSHAETLVNEMYSPENRGMAGLPGFNPVQEYEPESASTPQILVDTKRAVVAPFKQAASALSSVGESIGGTFKKYAIFGFVGVAVLIAIYAAVGGLVRR